MSREFDIAFRAQTYAQRRRKLVGSGLGFGVHGSVFHLECHPEKGQLPSALKIHERVASYQRERDAYLRLQALGVSEIRGCAVPELIEFDDELWAVEMSIVTSPFVLDFGSAYLDKAPEFPPEVMAEWLADKREQFGERWPEVQAILRALESYGIYQEDVKPANISLA